MLIKVEHLIEQMERQIENMKGATNRDNWVDVKEAASIIESYCHVIKGSQQVDEPLQAPAPQKPVMQSPVQPAPQKPVLKQPTTEADEREEKRNLLDF
ncbi:hypothetical protein JCM19047_1134 [Bacillus sp. JCM 19047]|uniref:YwdI family protein n=1 Tax=Shouchella miscanthi TaxID=2598861 RepID=A0ABU6NJ82_9BACI|nr:YwdI family protein [Shouchella miscanthi]MED4128234.1 YwdI family protein [Shouchella miscanthi]GAF21450.1 hypothetical protein JCM19047_1134 [Bacillus sp. JCM 19047]